MASTNSENGVVLRELTHEQVAGSIEWRLSGRISGWPLRCRTTKKYRALCRSFFDVRGSLPDVLSMPFYVYHLRQLHILTGLLYSETLSSKNFHLNEKPYKGFTVPKWIHTKLFGRDFLQRNYKSVETLRLEAFQQKASGPDGLAECLELLERERDSLGERLSRKETHLAIFTHINAHLNTSKSMTRTFHLDE